MGRLPTNSKTKLIQTANDLIWKSSYGSVSVDEICTVSGVKKGSFYYYFSSKAELAVAVIEESYHNYELTLNELFSTPNCTTAHFKNLATCIYIKQQQASEQYGHVCGCPYASLGSEMAGNDELIRKKVDEIFHRQETFFISILREMVNSNQLPNTMNISSIASEIHSFIMGQMIMARIQNDLSHLKNDLEDGLLRILGLRQESI